MLAVLGVVGDFVGCAAGSSYMAGSCFFVD
jgi:hypothetical protein